MKKFNVKNDYSYHSYYNANILDIWYQDNKIVAYVEGTYIYKTEMIIKNDKITNYYCSCPSSEGGMSFCKHLSGIVNYLKENEILELEKEKVLEEQLDFELSIEDIARNFRKSLISLIDSYYGRINCYNSNKFVDIIIKYVKYIDKLLTNKDIDGAFKLVVSFLGIVESVSVDSEDDYYEGVSEIYFYLDKIIDEYNYQDKVIEYLLNNYKENEISSIGVNLIQRLISNVENKVDANKIINLINNIKKNDYPGYELIEEMIKLTHDYIGLNEAIKLANKNRDRYSIRRMIIEFLEELNDEDKLIKELKRQIKDSRDLDLYEKLLSIYLKNNQEEAEKLLLEMINRFNEIKHYKKLKSIVSKTKMNEYRKIIIDSINPNSYRRDFLLEIYEEDKLVDKLFMEIKKRKELNLLSRYRNIINEIYHLELLDYYKELIIKRASKCYGRNEYYNLCDYLKELYSLNCPSDFVINLVKDMSESYKTKKAFREEIMNVLNDSDKKVFIDFISK